MVPKCLTTKTLKDSSSQYNQIVKLQTLIELSSVIRQIIWVCKSFFSLFTIEYFGEYIDYHQRFIRLLRKL